MRIHIHNRFSLHENCFFQAELHDLGHEVEIMPGGPDLAHRTRTQRLRGWAALLASAWKKSGQSLSAQPRPSVVFVNTHIEAMVLAFRRRLVRGPRPSAALVSFIVGQPKCGFSGWLRRAYYGRVLAAVDLAVCHTREELERYRTWYPKLADRLQFQAFGFAVDPHPQLKPTEREIPGEPYLFSAGRSSRDYATLIQAVDGLDIPLYVACDRYSELSQMDLPSNVTVLRDCYGRDFRQWLKGAQVAVTPLQPVAHSAGQMVVMEALTLGVPQIVTDVPGIRGYTDEGQAVELVPAGDVEALRERILMLWPDQALRASLQARGRSFFDSHLTRKVMWKSMFRMVERPSRRSSVPQSFARSD